MKKSNNSGKIIGGVLVAMVALITIFVIANVIESGRDSETLFYVGNAEMYEILNDRSDTGFFVYIGRPTCPACQRFEPVLRGALRHLGGNLRYFQTDLAGMTDNESEMTVMEILDEIGVRGVPSMVYIRNGEVVDRLGNDREREDILSFFDDNGGLN